MELSRLASGGMPKVGLEITSRGIMAPKTIPGFRPWTGTGIMLAGLRLAVEPFASRDAKEIWKLFLSLQGGPYTRNARAKRIEAFGMLLKARQQYDLRWRHHQALTIKTRAQRLRKDKFSKRRWAERLDDLAVRKRGHRKTILKWRDHEIDEPFYSMLRHGAAENGLELENDEWVNQFEQSQNVRRQIVGSCKTSIFFEKSGGRQADRALVNYYCTIGNSLELIAGEPLSRSIAVEGAIIDGVQAKAGTPRGKVHMCFQLATNGIQPFQSASAIDNRLKHMIKGQ